MKHIPILFSTAMVQAILEGRKTHTRRTSELELINKYPDEWIYRFWAGSPFKDHTDGNGGVDLPKHRFLRKSDNTVSEVKCPYGQPGDILWVRENFRVIGWDWEDNEMTIEYENGDTLSLDGPDDQTWLANHVEKLRKKGVFKLSDPENEESSYERTEKPHPLTPSIHMPKEACRLFLLRKSTRAERLQDISEQDAVAEGVLPVSEFDSGEGLSGRQFYHNYYTHGYTELLPKASFESLWYFVNGLESWNANPWVWVVEFERIEKPKNF